jgi:hypothetical protein
LSKQTYASRNDDPFVEPEVIVDLLAAVPDGPRVRFPDGGHNLQKTRVVLAEALVPWLRGRAWGECKQQAHLVRVAISTHRNATRDRRSWFR